MKDVLVPVDRQVVEETFRRGVGSPVVAGDLISTSSYLEAKLISFGITVDQNGRSDILRLECEGKVLDVPFTSYKSCNYSALRPQLRLGPNTVFTVNDVARNLFQVLINTP